MQTGFYVLDISGEAPAVLTLDPRPQAACNQAISWQAKGGFNRSDYATCSYDRNARTFRNVATGEKYHPGRSPYTVDAWNRFQRQLEELPRTRWRFEQATGTIRTVPGNHWVATFNSWDKALDHQANARLAANAPQTADALESMLRAFADFEPHTDEQAAALQQARDAAAALTQEA